MNKVELFEKCLDMKAETTLCHEFLCHFIFLKCSLNVFCVAPSHTIGGSSFLKGFLRNELSVSLT